MEATEVAARRTSGTGFRTLSSTRPAFSSQATQISRQPASGSNTHRAHGNASTNSLEKISATFLPAARRASASVPCHATLLRQRRHETVSFRCAVAQARRKFPPGGSAAPAAPTSRARGARVPPSRRCRRRVRRRATVRRSGRWCRSPGRDRFRPSAGCRVADVEKSPFPPDRLHAPRVVPVFRVVQREAHELLEGHRPARPPGPARATLPSAAFTCRSCARPRRGWNPPPSGWRGTDRPSGSAPGPAPARRASSAARRSPP